MSRDQEDDYDVGYGKPPIATRFQPGQSGNPKGRPKGVRNFRTEVKAMLNRKISVVKNGKTIKVRTLEAALMRLQEKALKGDIRSLLTILELASADAAETDAVNIERRLKQIDLEILANFEAPLGGASTGDDHDVEA